ncbi:hypothetical protein GCM10020258_30590 [Sphingomonas yabuuchiae]
MRHHPAGMARQHGQHVIFLARQMLFLATPRHDAPVEIDRQIAGLHHTRHRLCRTSVPQRHAQPRQQFVCVERLGDIIVRAQVERGDLLLGRLARRDDQDHPFRPAQQRDQAQPVTVGQPQVEQHRVGMVRRRARQRLASVARLDHQMPRLLQRVAQQATDRNFIIHH